MKALKIVIAVSFFTIAGITATTDVSAAPAAEGDSTVVTNQQSDRELFEKLEKGLVHNLNSDIRGVVESSLYNAIHYKVVYPEFSSERVERILSRLALEGDNHTLKYKAYLTLAYYKNQSGFGAPDDLLSILDYRQQNGIFFYLQEKVQSEQFTSNF